MTNNNPGEGPPSSSTTPRQFAREACPTSLANSLCGLGPQNDDNVLLSVTATELEQTKLRVQEQQQIINALLSTCARYRRDLETLHNRLHRLDEASEDRVELLASLYRAVDDAERRAKLSEARALVSEAHAARSENLMHLALSELSRLKN